MQIPPRVLDFNDPPEPSWEGQSHDIHSKLFLNEPIDSNDAQFSFQPVSPQRSPVSSHPLGAALGGMGGPPRMQRSRSSRVRPGAQSPRVSHKAYPFHNADTFTATANVIQPSTNHGELHFERLDECLRTSLFVTVTVAVSEPRFPRFRRTLSRRRRCCYRQVPDGA